MISDDPGDHAFGIVAWRDLYAIWHKDVAAKLAASQDVGLEQEEGATPDRGRSRG